MNFLEPTDDVGDHQQQLRQEDQFQPQAGFAPRRQYEATCINSAGGSIANGGGRLSSSTRMSLTATSQSKSFNNRTYIKHEKEKSADLASAASTKLSMEESLRMSDVNGLAMKTPVSILQEILSRRGITPQYELVQIEGTIHEPTFRYRVSFNDRDVSFVDFGAGRSKKEAKHAAARALIDKLMGNQASGGEESQQGGSCSGSVFGNSLAFAAGGDNNANNNNNSHTNTNANTSVSGDYADRNIGNPIGWLQEMCMSRRWPPPIYETETEIGLPHERLFTIACSILNYREIGKGKSKKIAKRLAAHKMWTRLQQDSFNHSDFVVDYDMWSELERSRLGNFENFQTDYVKLLAEIANKNQFEVTYVIMEDEEDESLNNLYHCLVQLLTLPLGVCHGTGVTPADAQRQAAQNGLEFLKIITKK